MRTLIFKVLLFLLLNVLMLTITLSFFRSSIPFLWFIIMLLHLVLLISFPYVKFFKIKKDEKN